jgi:putative ABC transport system permease protein
VSETISAHYVLMSIDRAYLSPFAIGVSVAYGFAAVLAGAYLPAREASHLDPAAALRPGATNSKGPAINTRLPFLIGAALIALSAISAYAALNGGPAPLSFAACFFLIVGFALAVPLISDQLAALVAWMADKAGALLPGIAARSYRRSLHRTAVTTGALMVSVAMMVGVASMISSFRGTVDQWVSMAMKADMFVAPAANEIIGLKSYTPVEVHDFLAEHPQVRQVDTYLELPIEVGDGAIYGLAVISGGTNGNFSFVGGGDDQAIDTFFEPDHVILSEPLSAKLKLGRGDTLTIPTPKGDTEFTVAGVYYDYSDDNGRIIISRPNFDRLWDEPRYHSLAIYLNEGADTTPVIAELRTKYSSGGELAIYTNRSIRERIFEIFDQTFAVTYVLRTIAIIVAALGIALTLATLVSERTREIGVMRAVGAGRGQIHAAYLGEAALIGLLGTIAGIVCGIFLSMLLTWVVNRAFFGWTIQFSVPWGELAMTPLWTVPVALLAGLFPAARAGNLEISKAVRME